MSKHNVIEIKNRDAIADALTEKLIDGKASVVCNGYQPERTILTVLDSVQVKIPKYQRCWVHKTANILNKLRS